MNKVLLAVTTSLVLVTPVASLAADSMPGMKHDMGTMQHDHAAATLSAGVVKKVDKAAGKLTIAHGPLQTLGMPGMTMAFKVKDPAWLDKYKAGDKINFTAEDINGVLTVTRCELAK